jgi:hypothetical protein
MGAASVRRRGTGSPERRGSQVPIAHAIGLPDGDARTRYSDSTAIMKPTSSLPSAASSPGGTGPPSSWPSGPTE